MTRILARQLIAIAANQAGLSSEALVGECRQFHVAHPRQRCMLVLRTVRPDLSPAAIGRIFGRDRTTVLHGIGAARARAGADPAEASRLLALLKVCGLDALPPLPSYPPPAWAVIVTTSDLARFDAAIGLADDIAASLRASRERALDGSGELFRLSDYRAWAA